MRFFGKKNNDVIPGRRRASDSPPLEQEANMFQRNRSLVRGSYSTRNNEEEASRSDRVHVHHLALKRRKVGVLLISVLLSALFLFWLITQFTAKATVTLSDTTTVRSVDDSIYVDSINKYMDSHPLSRLRFALDVSDLANYLRTDKPEVLAIDNISAGSIGETSITLSMRHPIASWTISGSEYFVDSYGVAFQRNYYNNPSLQIVDNSGITPEQGTTVASNTFLGFVGRVVALSKVDGYVVEQAIIPANTTRQLEIQIKGITSHVIFSIDRAAGEQVEDMSRALKYLSEHGRSPAKVDVRVSGKAFYL